MLKPNTMTIKVIPMVALHLSLTLSGNALAVLDPAEADYDLKLLGKYVFFDKISEPRRMACVSCHDPRAGGTPIGSGVNLHQVAITGANPHTVGNIATPTNIYASLIPPLHECALGGIGVIDELGQRTRYCGGNFWDGRAEGLPSALLPGATRHIGDEIFYKGADLDNSLQRYAAYFGATADQALNPMPNPVEQNIQRQDVCEQVASSKYAPLYAQVWGEPIDCSDAEVDVSAADAGGSAEKEFDISFKRLMLAICAWQSSKDLNSWSSKRDIALRQELACADDGAGEFAAYYDPAVCAAEDPENWGKFPLVGFTPEENLGHDLFYNTTFPRGGEPPFPELPVTNCSFCHLSDTAHPDGTGLEERYTDDAYHNIGTPVNPELPADPSPGISGFAASENASGVGSGHAQTEAQKGGFKTPTLRNTAKFKSVRNFTHNGWFKSLESLVHFYNTSAILEAADSFGTTRCEAAMTEKEAFARNCWPEAEWPDTVSTSRLVGNLGMTAAQEAAVVAYMRTLSDLETAAPPPPYKVLKAAKSSRKKTRK